MILAETPGLELDTEPAFLTRVRLRARRRVRWLRHTWATASEPGQGLAITHDEVDRALAPFDATAAERLFRETDEESRHLRVPIVVADDRAATDPAWLRLRWEFGLTEFEIDFLMLLAAVETDPALRRVCGYLHDDARACEPTPWLAAGLYEWPAEARLGPNSGIVRWGLARPADGPPGPWGTVAPWAADPHLVAWVSRGDALDPHLDGVARFAGVDDGPECLHPSLRAEVVAFVRGILDEHRAAAEVELVGPPGAGKRTLAAQVCGELGIGLLVADAGAVQVSGGAVRVARSARLEGAAVYWHDAGKTDPRAGAADGVGDVTFFGSLFVGAVPRRPSAARRAFRVPPLTRSLIQPARSVITCSQRCM